MIKCIIFSVLALFISIPYAFGVEITPSVEFARNGESILAHISFRIPDGYHTYANNPGTGGKPTLLDFVLEGTGPMPVLYPAGIPQKDSFDPSLFLHVYSGAVTFLAILPDQAGSGTYAASLEMLLCSTRNCTPLKVSFTGKVPENPPPLETVPWQKQADLLLSKEGKVRGSLLPEQGDFLQNRPNGTDQPFSTLVEASNQDGTEKDASPDDFEFGLRPRYVDDSLEVYTLGSALVLGIIAGLLLNAMPCVLPVLTLKVSGLLMLGYTGDKRKQRDIRLHNLCFAAGIFTLFTFLALLLGLADMMWGQLFQNQYILLAMLLLVFLMGLSMLGVFTLPAFDLRLGENTKNPLLKSYLTGLVSTFLATPCSGPLLGGVLAWAFAQPLHVLVAVFWSVGIGMGLPYLAFSICPALARFLPRPGAWMKTFENCLGFLLLATALYLLYILPEERRIQILCVLLLAAFCAWLWGTFCGLNASRVRRRLCGTMGILALVLATIWALRPEAPAPDWRPFSPQTFAHELGRRAMLVEFTADWCPNCKFLEASVLTDKNVSFWQKKYGLELIRVDLTRSNPFAESLLAQLGSRSIPLTALFPRGEKSRKPLVLRDVYGSDTLRQAMGDAF